MIAKMDSNNEQVFTPQNNHPKKHQFYLVVTLIILGLLLPAFDLGMDFYAIYQHWTSGQWILKNLAKGLIFTIFGHNIVSTWYGWRNWSDTQTWNFSRFLWLSLGCGNIKLAMEILAEITLKRDVTAR